jgi:hypothetical protein
MSGFQSPIAHDLRESFIMQMISSVHACNPDIIQYFSSPFMDSHEATAAAAVHQTAII